MREYKFKAWHKEAKSMLSGDPAQIFKWKEEGQPLIIRQYSGLKDKNGVEIYEGDIIACGRCVGNCIITFKDGAFMMKKSHEEYFCMHSGLTTSKVIGNIHENPELLKSK